MCRSRWFRPGQYFPSELSRLFALVVVVVVAFSSTFVLAQFAPFWASLSSSFPPTSKCPALVGLVSRLCQRMVTQVDHTNGWCIVSPHPTAFHCGFPMVDSLQTGQETKSVQNTRYRGSGTMANETETLLRSDGRKSDGQSLNVRPWRWQRPRSPASAAVLLLFYMSGSACHKLH